MFRLDLHQPVARLALDRPEARNAIRRDGWDELADCVDRIAKSETRALILSGASGSFCAGADLGDFAGIRSCEDGPKTFRLAMRRALDGLAGIEIPVVAHVDGPCYGAGVALALACDIRVAGPSARFAITPAKIGLSYPQEDIQRLVALVGAGQASRLLFTGAGISAEEALAIRLVEFCGGGEMVEELAADMASNAASSLSALKKGIRLASEGQSRDEGQDQWFDRLVASEESARRLAERGR